MLKIKGEDTFRTVKLENLSCGELLQEDTGHLYLAVGDQKLMCLSPANGDGWLYPGVECRSGSELLKVQTLGVGTKITLEVFEQEEAQPIFLVKGQRTFLRNFTRGRDMKLGEVGQTIWGIDIFRFYDRLINFSANWLAHNFKLEHYPDFYSYPNGTLFHCEVE